jgi:hypothetical protein
MSGAASSAATCSISGKRRASSNGLDTPFSPFLRLITRFLNFCHLFAVFFMARQVEQAPLPNTPFEKATL